MPIALLLLIAAIAVTALMTARWARTDGGPRPTPLSRAEDDWSPTLPSHPYRT